VVAGAKDQRDGRSVAIKRISDVFLKDPVPAKRTLREIQLLRHMRHENIIDIVDMWEHQNDIYIAETLMEADLHQIIRSGQSLSDDHFQFFIWQLLKGLKYMHSMQVIHRDLKPSNLLVNSNCDLKICDFGLARAVDSTEALELTTYVVTRWYRAPELMLADSYQASVDMWSVGCILAELIKRRALFPGKNTLNQLELITQTMGSMTERDIQKFGKPDMKAVKLVLKMPKHPRRPWESVLRDANPAAIDMIDRLLNYDPVGRLSAAEALAHPYVEALHQPDEEPTADGPFELDWEQEQDLTVDDVKELIHREIVKINPELATPTDMMAGASLGDDQNPTTTTSTEQGEVAVVHGQMTRMLRKPSEINKLLEMIQQSVIPLDFADAVHGRTLLHWAALYGRLKVVQALVDAGVSLTSHDTNGRSPFVLSLQKNFQGPHLEVANLLLTRGCLPSPTSDEAGEILLEVVQTGSVEMLDHLVAAQYPTEHCSAAGDCTMLAAARSGNVAMVDRLKQYGATLDKTVQTHNHVDLVMSAAQSGNVAMVSTMLEANLNVNSVSDSGMTPLLFAAQAQDIQMVEFLLMSGAHNNRFTELGRSVVDLLGQEVILDRLVALSQRNAELEEKLNESDGSY
jgi:mitogen-activated protein kinase 1/3